MEEIHRKVLTRNRPYLMKEVLLDTLWPHLVAREIFTDEMIEHIQATGAKPSQMQRLLSDLQRRGPNAYPEFLECLVDTDQRHIAEKLRTTEENLRTKEPKYVTPVLNSSAVESTPKTVSSTNRIFLPLTSVHTNGILSPTIAVSSSTNQATEKSKQPFFPSPQQAAVDTTNTAVSTTDHITSTASSLLPTQTGNSETVSLMDYATTATTSTLSATLTQAHPSLSFTSSNIYQLACETTPDKFELSSKGMVRRNLNAFFGTSINQTDNGNGIKECIQTTDQPQAVEINAYPEILGLPRTQGRLKIDVSGPCDGAVVSPNWDTMYKMTSQPRGYCLIINNRYFTGHLKERLGTDVDRDNLYHLFSQLGYEICIQENLTGMEMLLVLRDFSQLSYHYNVDSCAVVLLTHGLDGQVYGVDAKLINLNEVFKFFDGDVCLGLKGKPKFFVLQACRGEKYDGGFDLPDNGQTDTAGTSQAIIDMQRQELDDIDHLSRKLPSCSDFLIAYATIPGFVSWRNSEQGSWFVQAFCQVFSTRCRHDDALNMLVEVNNKVATIYESATKHKQMPSPVVLLRKKLYFFPQLTF